MPSAVVRQYLSESASGKEWSLPAAQKYCRSLAVSHYENFAVATVFIPADLRQHFYNVYAYCRISDDLGDEASNPEEALQLLQQWEDELNACYSGYQRHPVFVALRETIDMFGIPIQPFADLLKAFKWDQTRNRYSTYDDLLEYCRYSANPVGRLVLHLFRHADDERQELSDFTCTALQLANHWQDIAGDLERLNRIYLPVEDMNQYGYGEADLKQRICDERFVSLMKLEIERTRDLFRRGWKLATLVQSRLAIDVRMFSLSGLEVLRMIESVNYDVFRRRPAIGKWNRMKILFRAWFDKSAA